MDTEVKFQRVFLRSYAKINLGLHILGKREDGYHEIRTVLQTINLYDRLEIEVIKDSRIEFECNHGGIDPRRNLVVNAIKLLSQRLHQKRGFRVRLEKRIPIGAGLGGGSSNAAAALLGISKLLSLDIPRQELFEMGGALGSDVPFFFVGGKALGIGRGAEIYPLQEHPERQVLLVIPSAPVSTAGAYARVSLRLTKKSKNSMIPVFCPRYLDSLERGSFMGNHFEDVVFLDFPKLKWIKAKLLKSGALNAGLTGSGSALYGIFRSKGDLLKAGEARDLRKFQVLQTKTLSRKQYWHSLVESLQ